MPSQYSSQQKRDAMEMLTIGDDIGFVHYTTGIPERTLRQWRQDLRDQPDCQIAEIHFPSATSPQPHAPANLAAAAAAAVHAPDDSAGDHETFAFIRQQLRNYARDMSLILHPDDPNTNRRTLSLARTLDKIQMLDQVLPDLAKAEERPPWQDDYDYLLALELPMLDFLEIEEAANRVDPRFKARIYKRYADKYREKQNKDAK